MQVGDRVQRVKDNHQGFYPGDRGVIINIKAPTPQSNYNNRILSVDVRMDKDGLNSYGNDSINLEVISSNSTTKMTMTLKDKFALVFKGEPEKSLIKAGIMNADESLTNEGRELWTAFLVKKFGNEFKKEVVDPILAEEEKK